MTRLRWPVIVFAAVLVLTGLVLSAGGAWLVALGGSAYYVLAGIGLVVAGALLWRGSRSGATLYFSIFGLTIAWALWEVGFDAWALMPRIAGPAVLAVILVLLTPLLKRSSGDAL